MIVSALIPELQGRHLVIGVTGGVAAYKTAELVRLCLKAGATVDVVMTEAATHFVGPATFQALTGRAVWQDLWDTRMPNGMAHINLSRDAHAILIAPATADTLSRLALGRADDLLTCLCLARDCPLLVAPAMNRQMWENPATQRNVSTLIRDGINICTPDAGEQACGETGPGRMQSPEMLYEHLVAFFQPKILAGKKILITAGPTFEAIDPVRGITNSSSGKMGFALARAAAQAGAVVTLIAGPVALATPWGVKRIDIVSAQDMHQAVLNTYANQDVFISVAAVADFRPEALQAHKIKKTQQTPTLNLVPNPDILADIASRPDAPFCVGFAAESQDLAHYAESKRVQKKLGLVVGNLIQDALNRDDNEVVLFDAQGQHPLPAAPKNQVAQAILSHLARLLQP